MPKIRANEIEIEYEIHGQGEPLLLVQGLGYSKWGWHRLTPLLAENFQVITFDNRGMGGSSRTPGAYSAELLAQDTASLLEALNLSKAHIAGISMGGFVVQALALKKPELFDKMILMSTGFGGAHHVHASPEVLKELVNPNLDLRGRTLLACHPDFEKKEPHFFEHWLDYRAKNPPHPEGYQSQVAVGLRLLKPENSFEPGLANLKIPTLILAGDSDQVVPAANGPLLQKAIAGSRLVTVPQAGHFLPFEVPEILAQEMTKFLLEK